MSDGKGSTSTVPPAAGGPQSIAEGAPTVTPVTPTTGGQQVGGGQQVFTQEDVNRIVGERLARETAKYADYEKLKEQAANWQKYLDAQKSEQQKLAERLAEAERQRDIALQQAQERLLRAAIVAEAAKQGVAHPDDAYALIDLAMVSVDEEGNVKGAAEAVAAIVKAGRLPLAGNRGAPSLDGGAGSGQKPAIPALTDEEIAVARKMGLKPEDYAASKAAIAKRKMGG